MLFYNPRSGDGKAERFSLPSEARSRGIEPVELSPGDDYAAIVRDHVARGADALAMAGGDGSQAIAAAVASEHSLPYACVPAGTRNHFALDLGVDRDDVVGALDALVDGAERIVDLADVNGRIFVNNVSLGIYGEAVQRPGYRNAKLRTLLEAIPQAVDPPSAEAELRWTEPDGGQRKGNPTLLVSNDPYRLVGRVGSPSRAGLDAGVLGILVLGEPHARPALVGVPSVWRTWSAHAFGVESGDTTVAAGVDGEAARLDPPLQFRTRPGALKVRIARRHPGAAVPATGQAE